MLASSWPLPNGMRHCFAMRSSAGDCPRYANIHLDTNYWMIHPNHLLSIDLHYALRLILQLTEAHE